MKKNELLTCYAEYAEVLFEESVELCSAHHNVCSSCSGYGDHGIEEETGFHYTCYACGGDGKFFKTKAEHAAFLLKGAF